MSDVGLAFTGDLVLRTPGITARYANDAGFHAVRRELTSAAIAVANLETPISCRGHAMPKAFTLRADPAVMADVAALGLGAVTLANNHIMDFGLYALRDTLAACQRAGIACCGAGEDLAAALAPLWFTVDGELVALINVACTLPVGAEALPDRAGIAPLRVRVAFELDLSLLAEQPGTMPTVTSWAEHDDQSRICRLIAACRDRGAKAVIVSHPLGLAGSLAIALSGTPLRLSAAAGPCAD